MLDARAAYNAGESNVFVTQPRKPHPILVARFAFLERAVESDIVQRRSDAKLTMTSQKTLATCRAIRHRGLLLISERAHHSLYGRF